MSSQRSCVMSERRIPSSPAHSRMASSAVITVRSFSPMKCKLFPPPHMVSLPLGFKHPRAQLVYDKPNPEEVRRQLARALTSMGEHATVIDAQGRPCNFLL